MTVGGAPLDWRSSLAVRNHSPTGPAWGYGGSGPAQTDAGDPAGGDRRGDGQAILPAVQVGPGSDRSGPLGAGTGEVLGWPQSTAGTDEVVRFGGGGGTLSARRLLGAHLPAVFPERRETVAGQCLGCLTQFAIDVRLPLPATCLDCEADVLAPARTSRLKRSPGCGSTRCGSGGRNDDVALHQIDVVEQRIQLRSITPAPTARSTATP